MKLIRLSRFGRWLASAWLLLVPSIPSAHAYFSDDFSTGVDTWITMGDVAEQAGEAVLADGEARRSVMYKPIPLAPGTYTVDVDVRNDVSPDVPAGQLPDVFFASVYFVDDPGTFDLMAGTFDGSAALFDLSARGFANVQGQVDPSSKGPDWSHYHGVFDLIHAYAIPTFELKDDNALIGDSSVILDNLRIAIIPEPRAVFSFGLGLALLWFARRRIGESPIAE